MEHTSNASWTDHGWFKGFAGTLLFILLICGLGLFVRIAFWNPSIGVVATESEALSNANERLLEMVKWTISTILLVGGGLIGLNWYQNEKRLEETLNQQKEQLRLITMDSNSRLERLETRIHDADSLVSDVMKSHFDLKFSHEIFVLRSYGLGRDKSLGDAIYDLVSDYRYTPRYCQPFVEHLLNTIETSQLTSEFLHFQVGNRAGELISMLAEIGLTEQSQRLKDYIENVSRLKESPPNDPHIPK